MALITVADLRNELVGYTISPTSRPSEADVLGYIDQIEAEVQALWQAAGGIWPLLTDAAAVYPRLTILLGVEWRYLAARFATASSSMTPDAVGQARLAYNDRVSRIPKVAVGASEADVTVSTGPLVGVAFAGPISGTDLGEWTERRDRTLRRPFRPYGWIGYSGW